MLSTEQNDIKAIVNVPEHLYGKYNKIRSMLEYCDLGISYSLDAYDFLQGLRSIESVIIEKDGSLTYSAAIFLRQSFEFKKFKFHADHSTFANLSSKENENLYILNEGLGTTFSIQWEDGTTEEIDEHVGLSLYHCISINAHLLVPSENQREQLKISLLFGLCQQYDCTPKQVYSKLKSEFAKIAD